MPSKTIESIILATIATLTACNGQQGGAYSSVGYEYLQVDVDLRLEGDLLDRTLEIADVSSTIDLACADACWFGHAASREDSFLPYVESGDFQFMAADACELSAIPDTDTLDVGCTLEYSVRYEIVAGRLPEGGSPVDLGEFFATQAAHEALSVASFEHLAEQLASWGGPSDLIERCLSAARDEARHAQMMAKWSPTGMPSVEIPGPSSLDLFAAALHNAREGCINETWAAVLAGLHAHGASESELRADFTQIAADEARHAKLAWDLHAWFMTQLSPSEQARVRAVMGQAIRQLPNATLHAAQTTPDACGLPQEHDLLQATRLFSERLLAA